MPRSTVLEHVALSQIQNDIAALQAGMMFETYRSGELSYINGSEVTFTHGWSNFNPVADWYQVEAWAVCVTAQAGWSVGERVMLNGRRATISIDATTIYLQIGANGISAGRKSGNLNEFNLNSSRWLVYVQALREVTN